MTKAIVLFSGGLDSLLTTRILQSQEIEVIGLHIVTPFQDSSENAARWAEKFGIELVVRRLGEDYAKMLAHPRFGYGKGVNPCIDCRIAMCRAAKELMEERNADFVATGEVTGQRPNSQKLHQLNLVTKESGLNGRLLRPLSAKTLSPTPMEVEGIVDREKLYSYTGRSRGRLIGRAKHTFGIHPIPQPSTGCLLAEKSFAPRVRDLLKFRPDPTLWDIESLVIGRHLRIDPAAKAIISRRETDGKRLVSLFRRPDRSPSFMISPENFNGPTVLLQTDAAPPFHSTDPFPTETLQDYFELAGALLLRFCNPEKWSRGSGPVTVNLFWGEKEREIRPIHPNPDADKVRLLEEGISAKSSRPEETDPAPAPETVEGEEGGGGITEG